MSKSLLPLPLTAFEDYMLLDDRATYPMTMIARLRFAGQLDRKAASAAWEQVLARHPLLRATVINRGRRRPRWTTAQRLPELQWDRAGSHDRMPEMWPMDLTREAGLRGWVTADARQSALVLQVHHAACDGKAVLRIADDFVRGYASAAEGGQAPDGSLRVDVADMSPCEEKMLLRRGTFGLTAGKVLKMLPAQLSGLAGAAQFLFRQPVALLAGDDVRQRLEGRVTDGFPAVRTARLEAAELRRLTAAAAEYRCTVNDWLLRDFFLAVEDFRGRHETPRDTDWIRFAVPMNLRRPDDARMPAANVVSMVFLDRNARQTADAAELLRGIHEEMDSFRRRQLGLTFIWSLHALRAIPGVLAARVDNGRCEATCVVSNLGRALNDSPLPTRGGKIAAGNVLLEGVDFFVPLRPGTAASVALVFYAGELNICLQYDGRRFTAGQADELLATYLRMIRASIGAVFFATRGKAA